MELRKLIGFGKATFSITLPKKWIKENALAKGDLILIQEKSPEKLEISPKLTEQREVVKEATIQIGADKNPKELERELITAYINDYSIINITGDMKDKLGLIRETVNELIGLEIMEVSPDKIVTKVFSDVTNTHISNVIRRISLIIKTMFDDLSAIFSGKVNCQTLVENDTEINRQTYFARRILLRAIKSPYFRGVIKMELTEAVFALRVINSLERIGDQVKIVGEQICTTDLFKKLKPKQEEKKIFVDYIRRIQKLNEGAVKAYITREKKLANEIIHEVQRLRSEMETHLKEQNHASVPYVNANLGVMVHQVGDLAIAVLDVEF